MGRGNAGQKMEVVVDDALGDRRAGDVDHATARHAKPKQQAEHALLVVVDAGDPHQHVAVEGQARNHQNGARQAIARENSAELVRQPVLQTLEGGAFVDFGSRLERRRVLAASRHHLWAEQPCLLSYAASSLPLGGTLA